MNLQGLFVNGVPEDFDNLQYGQITIFSSPDEGMSEKNIRISQYVSSVARQVKKKCKITVDAPAVFVISTENVDLWEAIVCLVVTPQKEIIEIADVGSLTEMLYDYWGLDFNSTPKPELGQRYDLYHFTIGESHPIRVGYVSASKLSSEEVSGDPVKPKDSLGLSLDFVYSARETPTIDKISRKILDAYWEAEEYNVKIDFKKIFEKFEEERKRESSKTYTLGIDIKKNKGGYVEKNDIYLLDEKGEKNIIKMEAQQMAIYMAFLLYDDGNGIVLDDIDNARGKGFRSILEDIHKKMLHKNATKGGIQKKDINEIRCRIKKEIKKITKNPQYIQMFSIEGEKWGKYRIAASTEEIREKIREAFQID